MACQDSPRRVAARAGRLWAERQYYRAVDLLRDSGWSPTEIQRWVSEATSASHAAVQRRLGGF